MDASVTSQLQRSVAMLPILSRPWRAQRPPPQLPGFRFGSSTAFLNPLAGTVLLPVEGKRSRVAVVSLPRNTLVSSVHVNAEEIDGHGYAFQYRPIVCALGIDTSFRRKHQTSNSFRVGRVIGAGRAAHDLDAVVLPAK